MQTGITRRAILALAPGWLAAQAPKTHPSRSKPLPSVGEFYRFTDPTTENPVVRLTDPRSSSFLPAANNRFVSVRERFLLFSSDRGGKPSPFQVDLRSGVLRQIAETAALVPRSLCLDPKERILYFIDGGNLKFVNLGAKQCANRSKLWPKTSRASASARRVAACSSHARERWSS